MTQKMAAQQRSKTENRGVQRMAADIHEIEQMRSRYQGCLLGGAVGDALGYPLEFLGRMPSAPSTAPGASRLWNRAAGTM